jgi:hypothetical protein
VAPAHLLLPSPSCSAGKGPVGNLSLLSLTCWQGSPQHTFPENYIRSHLQGGFNQLPSFSPNPAFLQGRALLATCPDFT